MSLGELPRMIGPYKVLDLVGHGGMSTVYKALQTDLDRVVAIKVLLPALASDPSFRQRFAREARLVASLRHPNIVAIYGVGEDDGPPYIVMEYLDGPTLNALIRQRRETGDVFGAAETLAFVRPLCNALDYAHEHQIVHRDLKPENIICTAHGPVITDFGVAKSLQESVADMSIVIGTPAYMAPEQINGEGADRRTDVYALGVLLYELLTGHVPFTGPTPTSVTQAHLQQTPPSFATLNPYVKVAPGLEQVAQRALAKRPEDRWDSAGALYAALLSATNPTMQIPVSPRPVQRAVPAKPLPASNSQWGRLALLVPLLALLIGGLVAARAWGQSGEDGSDPRIATVETATNIAGVAETVTTAPTSISSDGVATPQPTAPEPTLVRAAATSTPAASPTADATNTPDADIEVSGRVTAPAGAYLRAGPGAGFPIVGGLPDNALVAIVQRTDGWFEVDADSGERGWIAETLIETDGTIASVPTLFPVPIAPPAPTSTAQSVAPPTTVVEEPPPVVEEPPPAVAGGEISLGDTDFTGGFRNSGASVYGGRTATWVYGRGSGYDRMGASFRVSGVRSGTAVLLIEGMDSEDGAKTPVQIAVNDVVLFEGASPFPNDDLPLATGVWGTLRLTFDSGLLREGTNVVSITNLASGPRGLPPFVAVDYALLQLP